MASAGSAYAFAQSMNQSQPVFRINWHYIAWRVIQPKMLESEFWYHVNDFCQRDSVPPMQIIRTQSRAACRHGHVSSVCDRPVLAPNRLPQHHRRPAENKKGPRSCSRQPAVDVVLLRSENIRLILDPRPRASADPSFLQTMNKSFQSNSTHELPYLI